jgi:competence protein ComGC
MKLAPLSRVNKGFTLIEVLVISPVVMITVILTMSYLFNQYGELTKQGTQIILKTQAQTISFSMQDDVFFSTSFASDKNDNLIDAYAPSGGWKSNTNPPTLILSSVALTQSRKNASRSPVYINTLGCSPDDVKTQNDELQNNIIYFASGTNLYKRILTAPSSLSTCGTSYQKQSCPAPNATVACPKDILLTDKLSSFGVTYYDVNNAVTTTPELAEKIKVDLTLQDKADAEDITASSSLVLKKLNE